MFFNKFIKAVAKSRWKLLELYENISLSLVEFDDGAIAEVDESYEDSIEGPHSSIELILCWMSIPYFDIII